VCRLNHNISNVATRFKENYFETLFSILCSAYLLRWNSYNVCNIENLVLCAKLNWLSNGQIWAADLFFFLPCFCLALLVFYLHFCRIIVFLSFVFYIVEFNCSFPVRALPTYIFLISSVHLRANSTCYSRPIETCTFIQ
jgi:hypothetical protein